ncbi:MAG: hypothetical protein WAL75_21235 [Terracidiphilus sp.]
MNAQRGKLITFACWRFDFVAHGGASMKLTNVRTRVLTSILTLGLVGATLVAGTGSVSAQSITVTTPFPFCVSNHAFPKGTYLFTPVDGWLLSIRNVNGGSEQLFLAHPEDLNMNSRSTAAAMKRGGVTFRNLEGVRTLEEVSDPGSGVAFELPEHGVSTGKAPAHQSPNEHACGARGTARSYNSAGN